MGGHKPIIRSGDTRDWLLDRFGRGFPLRGLVAVPGERGGKVDGVQVWRLVHAEGLRFKKIVLPAERAPPCHRAAVTEVPGPA